jgi:hypothetical protein
MAKIIDEQFSLEIKPEVNVNGWIEYTFNFLWKGKPIYNPEIMRDKPIKGDEIMRESLVSLFEEAVQCKEDGKIFSWYSDEPDIELRVKTLMKNLDKGLDGGFDVEVFFNEIYFEREENNSYGGNLTGVRVFQDRNDLSKFSKELREEYEASTQEVKRANPDLKLGA